MELEVFLSNRGNPDRSQHPDHPLPGTKSDYWVKARSPEQASNIARRYIEANNLGGGNFPHAIVREAASQNVIGEVSYNGRFWPKEEAPALSMGM